MNRSRQHAVGDGFDRDLSHQRRLEYRNRLHESLELAAGMRGWIDQAAGLGLRLAVASSSPTAELVAVEDTA